MLGKQRTRHNKNYLIFIYLDFLRVVSANQTHRKLPRQVQYITNIETIHTYLLDKLWFHDE